MLVLTREVGQSILIEDNIRVIVHSIIGGQVKLTIDAPKHIRVLREELKLKRN